MSHDPSVYRNVGPPTIETECAPEGWCYELRTLHSYHSSLDWIIPHLTAMGEGLKEPEIELRAEGYGDDPDCVLYVRGLRPLTDDEKERLAGSAQLERERELAELARLTAKYATP